MNGGGTTAPNPLPNMGVKQYFLEREKMSTKLFDVEDYENKLKIKDSRIKLNGKEIGIIKNYYNKHLGSETVAQIHLPSITELISHYKNGGEYVEGRVRIVKVGQDGLNQLYKTAMGDNESTDKSTDILHKTGTVCAEKDAVINALEQYYSYLDDFESFIEDEILPLKDALASLVDDVRDSRKEAVDKMVEKLKKIKKPKKRGRKSNAENQAHNRYKELAESEDGKWLTEYIKEHPEVLVGGLAEN